VLCALAGGVGAARFLAGLIRAVPPADVVAIVNTADDETFHGLHVSPDLDSVTYTLAGASNTAQGWGLEGETFAALSALRRYEPDTWFQLGDKDLATHIYRTRRLREGAPLSVVTAEIAAAWDLGLTLLPMTDDAVRTRISVEDGRELAMQEWFVRERSEPAVRSVSFAGAASATPAPGVLSALRAADTIVICPSNPVISIGPILALPGMREALRGAPAPVVAVSPFVGGRSVKGPTDAFCDGAGIERSAAGIARAYEDVIDGIVANEPAGGPDELVTGTMMDSQEARARLAREVLDFAASVHGTR